MAHSQKRPQRQDTTVYYSRRHAIQDLRAALNSNAHGVANLKLGESIRLDYEAPRRPGFNSKSGAVPYEVTFDLVTIVLERLSDGSLHLVHMSPRVPSAGSP